MKKTIYKTSYGSGITGFCKLKQNEGEILHLGLTSNKGYIFSLKHMND